MRSITSGATLHSHTYTHIKLELELYKFILNKTGVNRTVIEVIKLTENRESYIAINNCFYLIISNNGTSSGW
jgi:hypothetical protein